MNKPTVMKQLSLALLILSICCALFAYKLVVNYVQPNAFMSYMLLTSIAIMFFVFLVLKLRLKNEAMPYVYLLSGIGFLFFLGVVSNNSFTITEKCTVANIVARQKEQTHTKHGSPLSKYLIIVSIKGVKQTISCNQKVWYYSNQGNTIDICIRKGFLGGEYYAFK